MNKALLATVFAALSMMACSAKVQVQAKTPEPPPAKHEEPAPPPKEEPKAGEQIALPAQIEFELDRSTIKQTPDTLASLNKLAGLMKDHPGITKLRIEGHTDNRGTVKHNDKLSKDRAESVAKWLSQHEVATTRMTTQGFGSRKPMVPNDSEAHRSENRRTEYYIEEVDGKKLDAATTTVTLDKPANKESSGSSSAGGKTTN